MHRCLCSFKRLRCQGIWRSRILGVQR
ncbi:hypothetical protein AFLA70_739g000411 [Aspergillus flavus AF70]|nr:hypothetical protein AFLA70_739g000411 [Aspergillus flavus AF70]